MRKKKSVIPGFGLSFGVVMAMLGLIVIIPLCSLVVFSLKLSPQEFWETVTRPRVLASYKVSIETAFIASAINAVMGLAIAWVLVRYDFPGKRIMDGIIELPFALPTAVAGIKIAYTRIGITVALVFIGIPFVVRSVQPVLEKVDKEYEEAAAMFGASRARIFFSVILPEIRPALIAGFTMAFARALATQPHLLLLDEPFAAIDAKVRKELRSWLRALINQVGITSIFVTHDQEEAIEVADEIIVTNHGKIEQIGTPVEVYSDPATPFVAQFLGEPVSAEDYTRFKGFQEVSGGSLAIVRPEFVTVTKKNEFNPYPVTTEEGVVI